MLIRGKIARFIGSLRRSVDKIFAKDSNTWHSWDPSPWNHPWLTSDHLREVKKFSNAFIEKEKLALEKVDVSKLKIGFVGNIANAMYVRAYPMRRENLSVEIFLPPQDNNVMSHPWWEEFDGVLPARTSTVDACARLGISIPELDYVHQYENDFEWQGKVRNGQATYIRKKDVRNYPSYLPNLPTLEALQDMDVLWATQSIYLAYLSNKPYIASQMGGDIWFEASRNDELGRIQRKAFASARLIVVSNPWTFAHARRLGYKKLIYLPKIIDDQLYSPGESKSRKDWITQSGGDFFVLTSSRLDERNKGSAIGIKGFAEFAKTHPNARLVVIGWGNDAEANLKEMSDLGIADKIIVLPLSGKERLRDYLRGADVFIDQFVLGYFGSASMEAMACGLPVIGRIERAQYEALCETGAPPFHNSSSADDVTNVLKYLADNPQMRNSSSENHRKWFIDNHGSSHWMKSYQAVLAATAINQVADFRASPLNRALSQEEKNYHKAGLSMAPEFPNYGW